MNYQRQLFFAFILLIQADLLAWGQVLCLNNGNYTSKNTFRANLNATFSSLFTNVDNNGFYNASVGQGTDSANAAVLCRGDAQLSECRDCVQKGTAELLEACPNRKQAIRWDDSCILRYSNKTMYRLRKPAGTYYWWNPGNATSPDKFEENLRSLVDDLRDKAASGGPLRKVAAGNVTGPDFQTIFALVQCTPDLSAQECTNCLIGAAAEIPNCCDRKRGGRVLKESCILRFEIYPFVNMTRIQEFEPAPAPVPVPVIHPDPPLSSPQVEGDANPTRIAVIIVVPTTVCLLLVFGIILLRKRRKQTDIPNPSNIHVEAEDEIGAAESLQYAFSTIKSATDDFSDDNKLGEGGFGTVYKGKLPNGQEIAAKRLSRASGQGDLEFKNEVLLLAKLQHRNLVRLLGFAMEGMEKLLVYEFVQNGSLDNFIFDPINHSYLDWDMRYKIIVGIARGVLYLHEDSRLRIIHRDLKASNILLDRDMNPKIADFGMARLFGQEESQGNTSRVVGTYGYMPPEYILHGQFSIKSDVFSFGVMVLEIITGRKNSSNRNGDDLLSYAWKSWRDGGAGNVLDPFLRSGSGSVSEMLRCIHIGLLCVQKNAADRPTMAAVVLMLSSFSISIAVPSKPAFYLRTSGSASDTSHVQESNSKTPDSNSSSGQADQSDSSSRNDASITELYPR